MVDSTAYNAQDSPSPMPTKSYSPPKVNCAKGQSPWITGNEGEGRRKKKEHERRLEAVVSVSTVEQSPTGHQGGLSLPLSGRES